MANKKVFTDESLATFVEEIKSYTDEVASTKSDISHTHNYAGSSSVGGAATSAIKATQDSNGNIIIDTYMTKENPTGTGSFSMNRKANTDIGNYSHAEGYDTTASGESSHAEGYDTKAYSFFSHAEGQATNASGLASHAEGSGTHAAYDYSHAEGNYTKALGEASHAEGHGTVASSDCQHVQGKYNITYIDEDGNVYDNSYAHIVGNGTSDSDRSNAHTLDWSGNAWYAGSISFGNATMSYDETNKCIVFSVK